MNELMEQMDSLLDEMNNESNSEMEYKSLLFLYNNVKRQVELESDYIIARMLYNEAKNNNEDKAYLILAAEMMLECAMKLPLE